jgi:hypothetical protein
MIKNLFPAYRVFIYGLEVTSLVSAVNRSWPMNSPQQVNITIENVEECLTLTREDMLTIAGIKDGTFRVFLQNWLSYTNALTSDEQIELVKTYTGIPSNQFHITPSDFLKYASKVNREGFTGFRQATVIAPMTQLIANAKNNIITKKLGDLYLQPSIGIDGKPLFEEIFYKFPFYQGKGIFHFGDPVRVAMRDPRNPRRWHWFHSGTVTDITSDKTEDSARSLTITSEGVLKDLRNARVAQMTGSFRSPGVVQGPPTSPGSPAGTYELFPLKDQAPAGSKPSPFTDEQLSILTSAVPFSNFLQGLTINQILELLVFGVGSVLDSFSQEVRRNTNGLDQGTLSVIAERFGISLDKQSGKITDQAIKAREAQLRGLNLSGLSKFKKWKKNQGVQIRILGGPIDDSDREIGEALESGLASWQNLIDHEIRPEDLINLLVPAPDQTGPVIETGGRLYPPEVADLAQRVIGPLKSLLEGAFGLDPTAKFIQTVVGSPENLPEPPTVPQVDVHDVITRIGSDPDNYPIRQRVLMLLPAHLGGTLGRRVLDLDLSGCPATTAEYFDRLSLLQQVLGRIEFCIMDSPRGDIIVELPLYDFEPRHFTDEGARAIEDVNTGRGSSYLNALAFLKNAPQALKRLFTEPIRGYEQDFTIFNEDAGRFTLGATEQDVKTVWVSVPRWTNGMARDGSNQGNRQVVTVLPNLVPLFGFRVEQGDPPGNITTAEAARVYNHIQLNKANADTVSARLSGMLPNHRLWPNRPVLVDEESVQGVIKSLTDNVAWQSDCSTTVNLSFIKLWDGRYIYKTDTGITPAGGTYDQRLALRLEGQTNGVERIRLFVPFGGVNARPYNYAYLLGIESAAKAAKSTASNKTPGQGQASATNNAGKK